MTIVPSIGSMRTRMMDRRINIAFLQLSVKKG